MKTHEPTLTVSELARRIGVPASTVRYYERRKLLTPAARSSGNYRLFSEASVERLRFILAAKNAGFTLGDIEKLIASNTGSRSTCHEIQELIERRLGKVDEEIDRLMQAQSVLSQWLGACQRAEKTGRCAVLEGLAAAEDGRSTLRKNKKTPKS